MNRLLPMAAAAAIAVLVLWYSPAPADPMPFLEFDWQTYQYKIEYYNVPYVNGPGWYWLSAFWNYLSIRPYCEAVDTVSAVCTYTYQVSSEILSAVISGNCTGLMIYDYGVDDTVTEYRGIAGHPDTRWCGYGGYMYSPDCWTFAEIRHVWMGSGVICDRYCWEWPTKIRVYFPNATYRDYVAIDVSFGKYSLSDKYAVIQFDGRNWVITSPAGRTLVLPYTHAYTAVFAPIYDSYRYDKGYAYQWLVYVPEGCKLYVPYPYAVNYTVVSLK